MWLAITLMMLAPNSTGQSLEGAFRPPPGYERRLADSGSFAAYLRHLPLAPDTTPVRRYDGRSAEWADARVVDIPFLFTTDIEQCTDMAVRLYAEYQWQQRNSQALRFTLQNGQAISWTEWSDGRRWRFDPGRDRHVLKTTRADSSRKSFEGFLEYLFTWSGSVAAKRDLTPISESDLRAGDLIVQNTTGAMGHVSIILDVADDSLGNRLFLIGNGWTPAQNFFIRKPEDDEGIDWWFTLAGYERHLAPFRFGPFNYRRF